MDTSVRGHHWLVDCSDCACDPAVLSFRDVIEARCVDACRDAGVQIVGSAFYQFSPRGVTGVVLLAESHLSIHTWPDERFAALDVYVCHHDHDNQAKGAALVAAMIALLSPSRPSVREVLRDSVAGREVQIR